MRGKSKIGIVTICNKGNNYGGKLQNYALQTILERLGYDAETIFDSRGGGGNPWLAMTYIKDIVHYVTRYKYRPGVHKTAISFLKWKRKYLKKCPVVIRSVTDYTRIADRFEGIVVGSDQVWAPAWLLPDYAFARFVPPPKRIAYAPSFGVSSIPEELKEEYINGLKGFKRLSTREKTGKIIIEKLTGLNAEILLDPAMLLSFEEWNRIALQQKGEKYVFVYVLGELTPAYQSYIQELECKGMEIIDILRDSRYTGGDPGDFLSYIRDAEMIVTDSFHGTVFSLLYHKPVILLDKVKKVHDQSSRFDTLLDKFDICRVEIGDHISRLDVDWEKMEYKLAYEREVSVNYLKEALQKLNKDEK